MSSTANAVTLGTGCCDSSTEHDLRGRRTSIDGRDGRTSSLVEQQMVVDAPFHRMRHDKSVLALVVSQNCIYAGTQGGEILVFSLETYERLAFIQGHKGSVLGLCLSDSGRLLFSSAGDRIVNVWNTETLVRVYSIYSTYDIGDVFCVSYSPARRTVYLGAQNTSIQWYDLKEKDVRPRPDISSHPSCRKDKFFDSSGPGQQPSQRSQLLVEDSYHATGGQILEIDKQHIYQFAHFGYVYCMLLTRGILADDQNEEVLISGGGDGAVKIWKLDSGDSGAIQELYRLDDGREDGDSVLSIVVEGNFLYSGRLDGEINVWDLETKQLVRSLNVHKEDILTVAFGGRLLFCAGEAGIVRKFNHQYESVAKFKAHDGRILASAFTDFDGRPMYVTGGSDKTIAVWDVTDCVHDPSKPKRTSNELLLESLKQFVSYRTVSSEPRYKGDCRRGASYLRSILKGFGATTEMITTESPHNPIVFALFRGNQAMRGKLKKVLFYGHYDVIPADNAKSKWITDPFEPSGIDGYLYGRGTSDNKGPILAAVYAVAELIAEKSLNSDVVFLIEGEEECGSRGFEKAVRQNKKLIGDIDWILLANSYWLDDYIPCLTYGLRGVIHATVRIESEHPDLHSGVDGSALLDEPLKDLVMLLAKLSGPHGKVEIPGFYGPIPPLSKDEAQLYCEISTALLQSNPGLGGARALTASLVRRWREASLTIHRFRTSGPENSTIIPRSARAAISMRLVPNQTASEVANALVTFLHSEFQNLESKNTLSVTIDHKAEPWLGDVTNQMFQTLEAAVVEAWAPFPIPTSRVARSPPSTKKSASTAGGSSQSGVAPLTSSTLAKGSPVSPGANDVDIPLKSATPPRKPLYIREGGSIPAIRFLEKEFGAPAAQLPCGQASDGAHLDNERLRLLNLYKSKDIFKQVFRDLPRK